MVCAMRHDITLHDMTWYMMWYDIYIYMCVILTWHDMCYDMTWHDITLYYITWYDMTWYMIYDRL
jgi:hypothetical protein